MDTYLFFICCLDIGLVVHEPKITNKNTAPVVDFRWVCYLIDSEMSSKDNTAIEMFDSFTSKYRRGIDRISVR